MTEEPDEVASPQPGEKVPAKSWLVILGAFAGISVLLYRVYPAHHPPAFHPNFIDEIFAANLVLFAARLTLLSAAGVLAVAAVFIVVSFWKRAQAGHWMSRFGPLETQAVEDLAGQVNQWITWWGEENARANELQGRVEESEKVLAELSAAFQAAQAEAQGLRSGMRDESDREPNS